MRAVIDSFIQRLSSRRWPITIQAHNSATNRFIDTTDEWSDETIFCNLVVIKLYNWSIFNASSSINRPNQSTLPSRNSTATCITTKTKSKTKSKKHKNKKPFSITNSRHCYSLRSFQEIHPKKKKKTHSFHQIRQKREMKSTFDT